MRFSFAAFAILSTTALCGAIPTSHVVHEKRDGSSRSLRKRDRLNPDAVLPMRIGLKQRNLDRGQEFLMDV